MVFCCWAGGWGAAFFFRLLPKVPLPLLDTSVLVEEINSLELESLILSTEPFLVLLVFRMSLLSSSFSSASSGARGSLSCVGSIFFLFTVEELSPSSSWACFLWSCFCIGTWYSVFTFEKMFYYSQILLTWFDANKNPKSYNGNSYFIPFQIYFQFHVSQQHSIEFVCDVLFFQCLKLRLIHRPIFYIFYPSMWKNSFQKCRCIILSNWVTQAIHRPLL